MDSTGLDSIKAGDLVKVSSDCGDIIGEYFQSFLGVVISEVEIISDSEITFISKAWYISSQNGIMIIPSNFIKRL